MLNADALNQLRQLKTDIKESKVVYPGTVKATNGRFGFVALDEGRDVFLPPEEMQKVLPGDRITVSEVPGDKGRNQGIVEELLETSLTTFVGRYLVKGKGHFVAPEAPGVGRWIFIPPSERSNASPDDFIYCRIVRHPIKDGKGQAGIIRVLGKAGDAGIERSYTLASFAMDDGFSDAVEQQAAALSEDSLAGLREDREDLTGQPYVTIDSPGTQDMDDALLAEPNATGWRLSVAIADPTALIPEGSPADLEARNRATAIYFPGEPRAMLPEAISTRLCSLMPDTDRLALVCDLQVNNDGSLGEFCFRRGVIRSRGKLSYELVSQLLEDQHNEDTDALAPEITNNLDQLHQAATALRKWRSENALVNGDRPEFRLRLDENRRIRTIEPAVQNEAHRLVEECMVAANRCAAEFLAQQDHGLFIAHPGLRDDRADNIRTLLERYAPELASINPATPEGFRELMVKTSDLDAEVPVKTIIARQLARAEMVFEAAPHQGMGLPAYTTFTSPLRRYVDFYVHRIIKAALWDEPHDRLADSGLSALQAAQIQARQASGALENWLKSDYARQLDKTASYTGVITRTIPAGFFVRLDDNGLEGFVSCKTLSGKFSFDPITLRLQATKGARFFQLDQVVTVRMGDIDDERRQIHFELITGGQDAAAANPAG